MDCSIEAVALSRIAEDDRQFKINTLDAIDDLRGSIQKIGLINAPTLLAQGNEFIVVSGFRRIAACRSLGWDKVVARCLPSHTDLVLCALTAIGDNFSQRPPNLVESARSWDLLRRVVPAPSDVAPLAQMVGLPLNSELASKLNQVLQMVGPLQRALIDGHLALPVAMRLHAMADAVAARELAGLFQELQLSLNRQRELLEWVQGIAGREAIQSREVICGDPVAQWRHDPRMDRGQKTQLIRHYLRKRRYPEITAFEERYREVLRDLGLVEGMQLVPPQHFEGQQYMLQLVFKNAEELKRLCRETERVAGSPILSKLLNPESGRDGEAAATDGGADRATKGKGSCGQSTRSRSC